MQLHVVLFLLQVEERKGSAAAQPVGKGRWYLRVGATRSGRGAFEKIFVPVSGMKIRFPFRSVCSLFTINDRTVHLPEGGLIDLRRNSVTISLCLEGGVELTRTEMITTDVSVSTRVTEGKSVRKQNTVEIVLQGNTVPLNFILYEIRIFCLLATV